MEIRERAIPHATVLDLNGDLTYAQREVFKTAVEGLRKRGCRHVIVNMAAVRFVDSSGLGLLATLSQSFRQAQARLSVVKPQSYVREILGLAHIPKLIPICESEEEAVAEHGQAA